MKFKHPYFLLALIPLIAVLLRSYLSMTKGVYSGQVAVPARKLWDAASRVSTLPPRFVHSLAYGLACAFLIVALARPQTSYQKVRRNVEGIDMMVVLDFSASMRIEDFRDKNRIETAKTILTDFIQRRPTDKIGLQVFSGEAVTLVPPTLDHALLLQSLRQTEIGDLKDGTAIGDALATAVTRLKESTAKSRVLVLVTDGDSNMGQVDPLTAGELAKGFGIRVYSIAIGREGRVAMPFIQKDIFGRQVKTYQYFESSINPELLRKISSATGGKFYRVEGDANAFREVFNDIDQLERYKIETTEQVRYDEKFMAFAWLGIACFFGAFLLQNAVLRVYP